MKLIGSGEACSFMAMLVAGSIFVTAPAEARVCKDDCLTPGDYSLSLVQEGVTRTYEVHVPTSYTGRTAVPLLLDIHGLGSNPAEQRSISGQLAQSDKRGFIAVWPQGIGDSWNGYKCCGDAVKNNVDDVGFLRAVVASISRRANIAGDRVYASGLSNGWSMSMRLACDAADLFRSVAGSSQMLNQPERCHPTRSIGVTSFHGLLDVLAPYGGNPLQGFQSARQSFASWATINGCTASPVRKQLQLFSRSETFNECAGGVKVGLVTIGSGGHVTYINGERFSIADYIWDVAFADQ